jgi:transcriptional regulator with XRE-family HTH domain
MEKISIKILLNAFRHLLLEERNKHGFTQIELAQKSGLSRQCISLFESGHKIPTFFSVFKLAEGLDIPMRNFVSSFIRKAEYYGYRESFAKL